MVKPKFQIRLKESRQCLYGKPNSKAEAIVQRKHINQKASQIEEAVNWCRENNKRGHSALQTGMFPLIKDRGTIDRRLDGKNVSNKKDHLRILTQRRKGALLSLLRTKTDVIKVCQENMLQT